MALTPEMVAALAQQGHVVGTVLRITLPAGLGAELGLPDDELRVASAPFASPVAGLFDDRVISFGTNKYTLSDSNGNLQAWEITVRISDLPETDATADRSIGPFGRAINLADLESAPCVVQRAAQGVEPEDWCTRRTGILAGWGRDGTTGWALRIRADDEALRRPGGRRPKLTSQDWPAAFRPPKDQQQTVIGQYAPVALGRVDSEGLGDHGLRRTLFVDTVRHRYLVSLGTIGATGFRVFVDGLETTDPLYAGPAATRKVITQGGRVWTVVEFAAALTDEQVVTVDCQGLDLGSYGSYTSPAAQLRWVLEHLVFADWNGGALLAATHTDAATFATLATALGDREGAPGWLTLGDEVNGEEMIRRFGHGVDLWWNELGLIAVDLFDPTALAVDATPNVILQGRDTTGNPQLLTPPSRELWHGVAINYLLGPDGTGLADLSVFHPLHTDAAPKAIVAQWLAGRVI